MSVPETANDRSPRRIALWPGAILALFFTISLLSMRQNTLTVDEDGHWRYGLQILALDSNRFDDSKMPLTAINGIPATLGARLPPGTLQDVLGKLAPARAMTIFTAMLLGTLVFYWSREVYGYAAGILALTLFALEPNTIAHAQLVTTDLYAAATLTLAVYTSWRYSVKKDTRHALLLGFTLGLGQLAKYTNLALFLLIPLMLLVPELQQIRQRINKGGWRALRGAIRRSLGHGALVLFIVILVINAGFLFNRTFTPIQDYSFESNLFQALQVALPSADFIRVPVPYPYVEGLDLVLFRERTGYGFGDIYMLDQVRAGGFPGYYFVAFLFKAPLALQVILGLTVLTHLRRRTRPRINRAEIFMVLPILFFSLYFNFFYRAQIGIRYLLIIFPCILVYCGGLVQSWASFGRTKKLGVLALGGYLVVSTMSYYPHYIPYFNELILDRRYAYRVLADSNIDWEQSEWYLDRYLEGHPEALVEPAAPAAGRIIMGVNALTGVSGDRATYAWLRDNLEPIETIAYTYLVYDVSRDDLERILEQHEPR
jgi:4-amino-4-deoxy-L-arabinose transferase-like glycosyltransferase